MKKMTAEEQAIEDLAGDFHVWGFRAIKRIEAKTKNYGVLLSRNVFSDGKAG